MGMMPNAVDLQLMTHSQLEMTLDTFAITTPNLPCNGLKTQLVKKYIVLISTPICPTSYLETKATDSEYTGGSMARK